MRAMKDSGIQYIGNIPDNWDIVKLKTALCMRNESNNPIKIDTILSLTNTRGVIPYSEKGDIGNKSKEDLTGYKVAHPGDIVLNSMNFFIGSVGISQYFGCVSPVYYVFYPQRKNDCVRFFYYFLQNSAFQSYSHSLGKGILDIRMKVSRQDFISCEIPLPPSDEQQRIADFLDTKCAEIDEMIALQEKTVEELKAYKQSVITDAVTKGLTSDAPMKDSGIPWIGLIPQGWSVKRFKNILRSKLQYGANESGLVFNPTLPRYVRITDILDNRLREDIDKQSLTNEQAKDYILEDKDILFARSGTVGKSFIYKKEYGLCAYAGYLIRAKVDENNCSEFVYYYTLSSSYDNWKNSIFIQSTIQNIGGDKYSLMEIPCPPLTEQQAIASYLDKKCSEIDSLIEIKQQKAAELKNYKKSLIYEYVTGKKEVV